MGRMGHRRPRDDLVRQLTALTNFRSPDLRFTGHEPMIQPWLKDGEVGALLERFEAHRAEFRRVLPQSSTHVPVPGITARAGS